ncbi:MAG: glycosyltransferase [bacterium]
MSLLFLFGGFSTGFCLLIYGIYFLAVIRGEQYQPPDELKEYIPVSVLIPARNEEKVMERKIGNLAEIDYPRELLQVVIIDDASTDQTGKVAQEALARYQISGTVVSNDTRKGTNYNYNEGMKHAVYDIVITTDADVTLEDQALKRMVAVLQNDERIGAACGELVPLIDGQHLSTGVEKPYREVFGRICSWESSLHSTYCFNGPLIALRKRAYSPMNPHKGASDTNMALSVIRNGYQAKYISSARFLEWIPTMLSQQRRQKIRRASRLLESTWAARGMLFNRKYGKFGMIVLPLRMAMFFLVPPLCGITILFWGLWFFRLPGFTGIVFGLLYVLSVLGVILLGAIKSNFLTSFVWHQYYLLAGLMSMIKPMHLWESVDRTVLP